MNKDGDVLSVIDKSYMLDKVKRLWAEVNGAMVVAQYAQQTANGILATYKEYEAEVKATYNIDLETPITIDLVKGEIRFDAKTAATIALQDVIKKPG